MAQHNPPPLWRNIIEMLERLRTALIPGFEKTDTYIVVLPGEDPDPSMVKYLFGLRCIYSAQAGRPYVAVDAGYEKGGTA